MKLRSLVLINILFLTFLQGCDNNPNNLIVEINYNELPSDSFLAKQYFTELEFKLDENSAFRVELGNSQEYEQEKEIHLDSLDSASYFADIQYKTETTTIENAEWAGIGTAVDDLTCSECEVLISTKTFKNVEDYNNHSVSIDKNTITINIPIRDQRLNRLTSILDLNISTSYKNKIARYFDALNEPSIDSNGDGLIDDSDQSIEILEDDRQKLLDGSDSHDIYILFNSRHPESSGVGIPHRTTDIQSVTFQVTK